MGVGQHENPDRGAIGNPDGNPTADGSRTTDANPTPDGNRTRTLYSQWTQSLTLRWFPKATGNDYAVATRWRSGQTFGAAPFDELYALGMDRDPDLWLRAHRGIADGYKGASLLGDRYLLWNTELDKIVYNHPFLKLTAGHHPGRYWLARLRAGTAGRRDRECCGITWRRSVGSDLHRYPAAGWGVGRNLEHDLIQAGASRAKSPGSRQPFDHPR